jgi:hypothetical protein
LLTPAQPLDPINGPKLDSAECAPQSLPGSGSALGSEHRGKPRAYQETGQTDDSFFPAGLVAPPPDLPPELRNGFSGLSPDDVEPAPDASPSTGSFLGCQQQGGTRSNGCGDYSESYESPATTGLIFRRVSYLLIEHKHSCWFSALDDQSTRRSGITKAK